VEICNVEKIFLKNKPKSDFEVSCHISLFSGYVFVQVSKAASSSVKWALQSLEFERTHWRVSNVNNKFFSPHISPYQIPPALLDEVFLSDKYSKTTFVRNPFARILSCYLHRVVAKPRSATNAALMRATGGRGGEDVSFDEFVEIICSQPAHEQESHWRCQAEDLCADEIEYDFVGKVENIAEDLPALIDLLYGSSACEWYNRSKKVDASPMKTQSGELARGYYSDQKTRERLLDRYEADFAKYSYSTNIDEI
jgi:hypothetical protein